MKCKRISSVIIFLLLLSNLSIAQTENLLDSLPTTREGFIKSEPQIISTINWFENTPLNQEADKRKQQYSLFLAWLTNSPTVTINLIEKITPFTKKNPDLLFMFMGGWTKYTLQNSYSKDQVQCSVAGVKSAIKVYQMGNGIKRDKEMEKIIDIDSKNELTVWVKSQLGKE